MTELILEIQLTDKIFTDSPDAGDPACICSRCGKIIEEEDMGIRCWTKDGAFEWRYHPICLNFRSV